MKNPVRKMVVGAKKVPKSILVVTNTMRMRQKMGEIRALGYECTLVGAGGGAMTFLRSGKRANVVVLDLQSTEGAEKMIRWINENRPGVRVVCILNTNSSNFSSKATVLGARVLDEGRVDDIPKIIVNLMNHHDKHAS